MLLSVVVFICGFGLSTVHAVRILSLVTGVWLYVTYVCIRVVCLHCCTLQTVYCAHASIFSMVLSVIANAGAGVLCNFQLFPFDFFGSVC